MRFSGQSTPNLSDRVAAAAARDVDADEDEEKDEAKVCTCAIHALTHLCNPALVRRSFPEELWWRRAHCDVIVAMTSLSCP